MLDLTPWIEPVPADLVVAITGRTESLFAADVSRHLSAIHDSTTNARLLVIGAAGSIGGAFVKLVTSFALKGLALVDISENGLADLVRDLRSSGATVPADFRTTVAAFGSPAFLRFLEETGPYDAIFNFSALKHVRTERDAFGLMRMIETNALSVDGLFASGLVPAGSRFFSVSTDKAVNPTNLMGATKRWMERVIAGAPDGVIGTSARFANVAFSAGSLPQAFLQRLALRQPLAGPSDVSRYFISHLEAAQLCLLAGFVGDARDIFVPRLDARDALSMMEVARRVLNLRGFEPAFLGEDEVARLDLASPLNPGAAWPCVFTPSNTSGEKELEELTYGTEPLDLDRFDNIMVARQHPAAPSALEDARHRVSAVAEAPRWRKHDLIEAIRVVVPELRHQDLGRSLDEKM